MINPLKSDIELGAETVLLDRVEQACVTNKKVKREDYFNQSGQILYLLDALTYDDYLEADQINNILECLKQTAELYDYPVSPGINELTPPVINTGPQGVPGIQGERGEDGGGTDFNAVGAISNTVADSFAFSTAQGARWDFLITDGTNQEAGSIWATWLADGSSIQDSGPVSTSLGTITGISLTITIVGVDVRLNAIITSGTWTITGSRYFIPNNGAGVVPPTGLSNGKIWIGSAGNQAVEQTISGDISITSSGVVSYTPLSIVNADVSASAGIGVSKLAALTASRGVVSDGSGFLTTSTATATEVGYLSGVTSNIQTQLDSKLSAATGAISTVVSTNLTASRAVISDPSGKIAVSGVTTTELGYSSGVTSAIQTQINAKQATITGAATTVVSSDLTANRIVVSNGSGKIASGTIDPATLVTSSTAIGSAILSIGDWNMDSTSAVTITATGIDTSKIRVITGLVRSDPNFAGSGLTQVMPIAGYVAGTSSGNNSDLAFGECFPSGVDTSIVIRRRDTSTFDSTDFNATSYNRGWITVTYEL